MDARFASFLLLLPAACEAAPTPPQASASASTQARGDALSVGSEAVAAIGKVRFVAGHVVAVTADEVAIEHGGAERDGERARLTVPRQRAWPRRAAPAEVGAHRVCRIAEHVWVPCRVEAVRGEAVEASDPAGRRHALAGDALVATDADTARSIGEYLSREAAHRAFDSAFLAAGRPRRPAGWQPAKGDEVVIHFVDTSWYGGTVLEPKPREGAVLIDWHGDTWSNRDVASDRVVPQPRASASVRPGQYVLVRPADPTGRWEPHRVVAIAGERVSVVDRSGRQRSAAATDLIPVEPAQPG